MKILKNYDKTVVGISTKNFAILKNQKNNTYNYYVNVWVKEWIGIDSILMLKTSKKNQIFNKYILTLLSFIINIFIVLVSPFIFIFYSIRLYIYGAVSFFRHSFDVTGVRFFNWVNIVLIKIIIITYIFNKIKL